jgi:hypothetical protein
MTLTQARAELATLMSAIHWEHRHNPQRVRRLCRYHRDAVARAWRRERAMTAARAALRTLDAAKMIEAADAALT